MSPTRTITYRYGDMVLLSTEKLMFMLLVVAAVVMSSPLGESDDRAPHGIALDTYLSKRAPSLSLNGDILSLTTMLASAQRQRRRNKYFEMMMQRGKRLNSDTFLKQESEEHQQTPDTMDNRDYVFKTEDYPVTTPKVKRTLSIYGPLRSLAAMIQNNDRLEYLRKMEKAGK